MIQKMFRLLIFMQLLAVLTISVPLSAYSGEIMVKPGKFDHFNISMPDRVIAGEDVAIMLQAVDSFNNPIINFGETEREFHVFTSGAAALKNTSFKSSAFASGIFTIVMSDKVAETVNLSIREVGSPLPVLTKDLVIVPNKLSSFVIKGPRLVTAGDKFEIKVMAMDSFGNIVTEPIAGKNLNLIFKGEADPKVDMPSIPDFKNGTCIVRLVSEKYGNVIIEAKDLITSSSGVSEKIEIVNGPVNSFRVFAPKDIIAGEAFEVSIVAIDRFNNVVSNYAANGSGVAITTSGKLKPFPSTIPNYEFINGQAKVDLRYDAVEDISLIVTENGKNYAGRTNLIKVIPPIPSRFDVITPETALAGQKFKIKITVYNQLGHVIRNFNIAGADVQLTTTGAGILIPNRIPPTEFINGTAVVEVQYNKSEAFAITASTVKPLSPPPAVQAPVGAGKAKAAAPSKQDKKAKKTKEVKKAPEAKAQSAPLEITNVSLVGSKKKSTIEIQISNLSDTVKYGVSSEKIKGNKWIVVKLKPAVNKVEKALKFDSAYVGNIAVEEDKKDKDTVLIKIEQLKSTRFHVTKGKDSISVTLKH